MKGETYTAELFSTSDKDDHPGIPIFPYNVGVKVRFSRRNLHMTKNGKYRVKEYTVLEDV